MKTKILAILLCAALASCLLPTTAQASTTINRVDLSLAYPQAGNVPPMTATWHGEGYSIYAIDWYDRSDDYYLEPDDKIQVGHAYGVTLWVEADSGYSFNCMNDNTPNVSAYVNGTECEVTKAYEYKAWSMINVTYYFSYVPQYGWLQSVDLTVPAPVAGAAPYYGQITTDTYHLSNVYFNGSTDPNMKNGISWYRAEDDEHLSPDAGDTFEDETAYVFHCPVFPEEGYRLSDITSVTVNGHEAVAHLDYDTFLSVRYEFPKTGSSHVHTPDSWYFDSTQHFQFCTGCGQMMNLEDHKGGASTCVEKAECSVCGFAYGQFSDDHKWGPKYDYRDAAGHAWVCADCHTHDTMIPHTPGPEATETDPQKCTQCDYIIAPAKSHIHELTKVVQVEATCTQPGNIEYYACSGCSDHFTDAEGKNKISDTTEITTAPLGHTVSDEWTSDEQFHWHCCTLCNEVMEETKLLHDGLDAQCLTCGYNPNAPVQPEEAAPEEDPSESIPEPTDAEQADEDTEEKDEDDDEEESKSSKKKSSKAPDLLWLWIGLAVLVISGAVVAVILIKKKK